MPSQTASQTSSSRPIVGRSAQAIRPFTGSSIGLMGAPMRFARDAEIYADNEPAEYLYKLVSGTVRSYKILEDGRRQIESFYLPGDIFGLEIGSDHTCSADAITGVKVLVIKRSALLALADRDNNVACQICTLAGNELQRGQNHVMLLVKSADERVANFLLEIADRNQAGNEVELTMTRQDIADYLGLTIETISRTLTHLEKTGAIALRTSRRIVLRNRTALKRLNA